jgi:hypothetical protein
MNTTRRQELQYLERKKGAGREMTDWRGPARQTKDNVICSLCQKKDGLVSGDMKVELLP